MKVNSIEKNVDDGKFYDLIRFCIYRVSYCKYFISYLLLFESFLPLLFGLLYKLVLFHFQVDIDYF